VSVIIGLAVTHLVLGLVDLVQERSRTRIYWVHLLWVLFTLSWLVDFWWFFFAWRAFPDWTMGAFRLFLAYALTLSVIAGLLFPVRGSVADYKAFFYEHHRWFFGLIVVGNGLDVLEVFRKAEAGIREVPAYYLISIVTLSAVAVGALFTKNERYHAVIAVFGVLWALGYATAVFGSIG
jgi:hypothetical protein